MRIEVEGIERECQVTAINKGCFCIYDYDEGCYGFPIAIAVVPAFTEEEKDCGNILVCPISGCNGGSDFIEPCEISTSLNLKTFKDLARNKFLTLQYKNINEAVEMIYDEFQHNEFYMSQELREYISNRKYLTDKFFENLKV